MPSARWKPSSSNFDVFTLLDLAATAETLSSGSSSHTNLWRARSQLLPELSASVITHNPTIASALLQHAHAEVGLYRPALVQAVCRDDRVEPEHAAGADNRVSDRSALSTGECVPESAKNLAAPGNAWA